MNSKIKILAYYLPQYHPIPENDEWWGEGFTEWTNVRKAKPLFEGHQQPIVPGELGYYDLLKDEDIQSKQAQLAKEYGIDGLIYYQYWFDTNKMLLEKPAEKMLKDKSVDIPFCFCWANTNWESVWHGITDSNKVLVEQQYGGKEWYEAYFDYLLPFFRDNRYIKVKNMPMFQIYMIELVPNIDLLIDTFNEKAIKSGYDGIYFVGNLQNRMIYHKGIYAYVSQESLINLKHSAYFFFSNISRAGKIERRLKRSLRKIIFFNKLVSKRIDVSQRNRPIQIDYQKAVKKTGIEVKNDKIIPVCVPNWDNSPRSGQKSLIFNNATPSFWKIHLEKTVKEFIKHQNNPPFIFIKSWNEWAEGNYLEPDNNYGREWLEVVKEVRNFYSI